MEKSLKSSYKDVVSGVSDASRDVAAALMIAFRTKNIWVSDVTELQQDGKSLDYLSKTWKQENRDWKALEFLPAHVFKRLVKLETTPISPPDPLIPRLVTRRTAHD